LRNGEAVKDAVISCVALVWAIWLVSQLNCSLRKVSQKPDTGKNATGKMAVTKQRTETMRLILQVTFFSPQGGEKSLFEASPCCGFFQGHYCTDFLISKDKNHHGLTPWWSG
jgi:hypothetical protein